MMEAITKRQIKAIWALAHHGGLNAEDLHRQIESSVGKRSLRQLSREEAARVIQGLLPKLDDRDWMLDDSEGNLSSTSISHPVSNPYTSAQMAFMGRLIWEMGWDQKRLLRLAYRMYGVRRLADLTVRQASGLIEALKAIGKRHAA